MEERALIFDAVEAIGARHVGSTPDGQLHHFDIRVRHSVEGREQSRATIRACMTDSAITAAQTPVEVYVARHVEWVANSFENDGQKLERLQARVEADGGSLQVPRPADPQDYGRPIEPAFLASAST